MSTEENEENYNEEAWNEETRLAVLKYEEEERERKRKEEEAKRPKPPAAKTTVSKPPVAKTPAKKMYRFQTPLQTMEEVETTQILNDPKIVKFFQGREIDPDHFFFNPEGNLETKGAKDFPDSVIFISKQFQPLDEAMYADLMQKRQEMLKEKETLFQAAIANLRQQLQNYTLGEVTAESVVQANISVLEASKARTKVAYPERWTNDIENPVTMDILMMYEPYEKRKMGYDVKAMKHNELSRKDAFGRYVERTAEEEEEMAGGAVRIRFITDAQDKQTGHFHPFSIQPFKFNETEYCSSYQAFEGERFKQLGKEDLRKQILGTRSGRTMHSIAIKDKTMINAPQQLWEDILVELFYQHPDLRKELDATATDRFHVMDKEVPAEYGMALEKARLRLRELGDKELDHQEAKEKAITEEEQKKAKVGAIIHNFKKKF